MRFNTTSIKIHLLKATIMSFENLLRPLLFDPQAPPKTEMIHGLHYGPFFRQNLDIYIPYKKPPYPILFWLHGGGFLAGGKSLYHDICRYYAAAGYLVFNVNYRLAPRWTFPIQLQDAAESLVWCIEHAPRYGGSTDSVFLAGDSAGAYLSAWLGAAGHVPALRRAAGLSVEIPAVVIKGLLLFYGLYDLKTMGESNFPMAKLLGRALLGPQHENWPRLAEFGSVVDNLSSGFPTAMIVAGEQDPVFPQSRLLANAMERHGLSYSTLFLDRKKYPGAHHGFLNFLWKPSARIALSRTLDFMENLRD